MNAISLLLATALALGQPQDSGRQCLRVCVASDASYTLLANFEGYSAVVYKDSAGLDTIGIGHLIRPGEKFTVPLLPEDAHRLLIKDAAAAVRAINRRVSVPLRQHQADALISWTFNLGEGALSGSTLLRRVNAARHDAVPAEFVKWVKAGRPPRTVPGLVIRRTAEAQLYALK